MKRNSIASLAVAGALVVMACIVPPQAGAQDLARRLASVKNGTVRMSFASRDDICGYNNGVSTKAREDIHSRSNWDLKPSEDVVYGNECSEGPARVVARFTNGQLTLIRTYVGGRWRPAGSDVTDLGSVSVKDATDYLLGIARTQSGKAAGEAIFPVTLADSINPAQPIYSIAKDVSRPFEVRDQAIFWLSQVEDDAAVGMLDNILKSSRDDRIQDKAIFGLSQHRSGKGFAILRDFAERESESTTTRGKAIFWLGQGQTGASMDQLANLYDRMNEREMKDQMIFVFSQRREPSAMNKLMDIAKNDKDREARKKAMFWLGQSKEARVSAFLSDMINR